MGLFPNIIKGLNTVTFFFKSIIKYSSAIKMYANPEVSKTKVLDQIFLLIGILGSRINPKIVNKKPPTKRVIKCRAIFLYGLVKICPAAKPKSPEAIDGNVLRIPSGSQSGV